jgi:hypothetical protein
MCGTAVTQRVRSEVELADVERVAGGTKHGAVVISRRRRREAEETRTATTLTATAAVDIAL